MKSTVMGIFLAMSLLVTTHAVAHSVIGFVYAEGWEIEGEIGFSDGQLAPPGTLVEIFGPDSTKLGETRTKTNGAFHYTATSAITHHVKANLGSGHAIELILEAEALPNVSSSPNGSALNATSITSLHTDSVGNQRGSVKTADQRGRFPAGHPPSARPDQLPKPSEMA